MVARKCGGSARQNQRAPDVPTALALEHAQALHFSLSPFLRGEGWGEGLYPRGRLVESPPRPDCIFDAIRPLPARGARLARTLRLYVTPSSRPRQTMKRLEACRPGTTPLFRVFLLALAGGNSVGAGQPAVQIDVAAAFGAERRRGRDRRLAADRAWFGSLAGSAGFCGMIGHRGSLHDVRAQLQMPAAFSQPKRIGKPSPPSRVQVS
jgi:hypothetical protein